ncbi:hypothetical protein QYF36_016741 [Acer negundo]|nr:hypothetical protein QYF36_016741 [Acer negundo]
MDEASIVKWIMNGDFKESEYGLILDDIDSLMSSLGEMNFNHIDRHANRVVHDLASLALKSYDDSFWMEDFLTSVGYMVLANMPS